MLFNNYTIEHTQLRCQEALVIFEILEGKLRDRVKVMEILVPHIVHEMDARNFVFRILQNNPVEFNRFKQNMAACYGPMLGFVNGFV